MKVTDYIANFLFNKGIQDVFGYPGGMVTHLMDSLDKSPISMHINYNEQGASLAACGYAQISGLPGVAFATSGPGVTNLMTGIANAYFDSIPTIFITGQVNTYESKGDFPIRQKGFQEMEVVEIVTPITKYAARIDNADDVKYFLERAFYEAMSGRRGPVVLDIPMNIQRAEIEPDALKSFVIPEILESDFNKEIDTIFQCLKNAKRPVLLVGAGVMANNLSKELVELVDLLKIPVVSSMLAVDIIPENDYYYGFIGAYGDRQSNFITAKSDLVFSIGSRLDIRQTGGEVLNFAKDAKLIRVDIDESEFHRTVKEDEFQIQADLRKFLPKLIDKIKMEQLKLNFSDWFSICNQIKKELLGIDELDEKNLLSKLSEFFKKEYVITTDVGQNQVWAAQSVNVKPKARMLFSGGHGAMGYSLPAAIGAYYASKKPVYAIMGDGGLQMNIQELAFLQYKKIPVKIILVNNKSLGMIRHFQEMYFDENYTGTKEQSGYFSPNFESIAKSYELPYLKITEEPINELAKTLLSDDYPAFIEIITKEDTYVFPKLAMGKPNEDQEPPLERDLFKKLSDL